MDSSPKSASLAYGGLVLALAVAIGILGAKPFAAAAGLYEEREPMFFLCGLVLFFLSLMLLRFLFQLGTQIVLRLGQIRERPGLPIAITLVACGTLCVLMALLVAWHGDAGGLNLSPTVNLPGNMPGGNMMPHIDMSMQISGSLTRPLAICAALVIGVVLLALGVWSSLAPAVMKGNDSAEPK